MEAKTELERNAIATARRKELESYQRALDRQWLDSRMADGGISRCLAVIKREAEMEKEFRERTDHAALVNKRAEEETALGREVAKIERENINLIQRRLLLRERDPELRELNRKLEAGYVCRDLKLQILQNESRRLQEKADEQRAVGDLRESLLDDGKAAEARHLAAREHCRQLQLQLTQRRQRLQSGAEEGLIEKKMLEDVMRTISEEDQRELQRKRDQTNKMREEMVTSQRAKDAWRDKQRALVVQEEAQIEEQARAAADRGTSIIAERERKLREKEALNEIICAKILAEQAAKQERSDLITLLQEQEYLEKNSNDDIAQREKAEKTRKDTKEALTAQMRGKGRGKGEERMRDEALRAENEAKFLEENEKERQKALAVRQRNMAYSQQLKQQIEDNKVRRERDRCMEEEGARNVFDTQTNWKREIQEERKKIITEHAPPVLGYLQAGVLKPEDLESVRSVASGALAQAVESMGPTTGPKRFAKCNPQCKVIRNY